VWRSAFAKGECSGFAISLKQNGKSISTIMLSISSAMINIINVTLGISSVTLSINILGSK
jgi:hypothetical protein